MQRYRLDDLAEAILTLERRDAALLALIGACIAGIVIAGHVR